MPSSAEILKAARARISDPKRWTQVDYAKDDLGNGVIGYSNKAVCWCAFGALQAEGSKQLSDEGVFLSRAAKEIFNDRVARINDLLGHSAVLRIYDRAIELAEGK